METTQNIQTPQDTQHSSHRDVLQGGVATQVFPGYGGANYRLFIRFIVFVAIIILAIWAWKKFHKKQVVQ